MTLLGIFGLGKQQIRVQRETLPEEKWFACFLLKNASWTVKKHIFWFFYESTRGHFNCRWLYSVVPVVDKVSKQ